MQLRLRWDRQNSDRGVYIDIDLKVDTNCRGPGWFANYEADPWRQIVEAVEEGAIYDGMWVFDQETKTWKNRQQRKSRADAPRRTR